MKTNYLKNWIVVAIPQGMVISGEIYNDIKKRFEDGTVIHTSRVLKADFVNGVVETLNSVYHLELKNKD